MLGLGRKKDQKILERKEEAPITETVLKKMPRVKGHSRFFSLPYTLGRLTNPPATNNGISICWTIRC